MRELSRELKLSMDQQEHLREIVASAVDDLERLSYRHQPDIEEVVSRGMASMKAYLKPDQQRKLDELYERFRKHRGQPSMQPPPSPQS